ncbi:hypothetical protein [Microlunatus ginsengisoli]|uniref:FtsX-like permease family protein n=1 Tax=Microlunatus ginsengisoli TaxID=363863 RepID=A0ABP6ZSW1_9ACTN
MRIGSIVSEAWRNLVSGTSRAGWLAAGVVLVAVVLAGVDVRTIVDLQQRAAAYDASGGSVRVVAAEKQVAASSCEALGRLSGVGGAGAWRARRPVTLTAVAQHAVPAYEATPGLAQVLRVRAGAETTGGGLDAGVWLPEDLATRLGVRPGSVLASAEGPLRVSGTYRYPDDGRDSRFAYAVLVPVPVAGRFDACWARVWPANDQVDALLATAPEVVTEDPKPVSTGRLNNSFGDRLDAHAELLQRPTRFTALGAALAAALLAAVITLRRRLEHASALHAGVSRSARLAIALTETVAWSVAALLVAAAAVVGLCWRIAPAEPLVVAAFQLRWLVLIPPAAVVGTTIALTTIRERHLFGYFKDR